MNQNRAQRYVTALLAAILLFALSSIGSLVDQAAGVTLDRALMEQFQECRCLEAGVPLAADIFRANVWTITGAVGGLALGLLIGWVLRLAQRDRSGQPRRFSSFRQASELARFSQALSDTLEPQRILARLHTEVMHVTGADCGSSFLLDPSSPEHRVAHRTGEGAELVRLNPMEASAVSTARSRIVPDFEAEGEPPPHVGIRSALLVPITHEENAIGLIHLHSQTPNAFDSEFQDFVQVLAAQAAVAINNAQRYEEQSRRSEALRQRVNQLQQLSQIPNTVRVDRPLAGNLESIAQAMQDTAGFGFTLIYVFAPEGNHLALEAAAGLSPEMFTRLQQQPVPWERLQPFLREEIRSNRVYAVPHGQTAEVHRALELGQPRHAAEPRQPGQWHPDDLLLVPLYGSRGEIEGLLAVNAPREAQTPQNAVLEMLEVFASQAALAVENAQLLSQAEERVAESQERAVQLSALTEATGLIAASLRVDEVITLGLDQLRRLLPYDTATFWRRDPSEGRWRVAGARSYQEPLERVIERAERAQPVLFGEIAATRSVMFVADVSRDVRFSAKDISSMRAWLGVPVLASGEVSGILALEKAEDGFYGAGHVPVALAFANRLAVALQNARLYEESVQHAREMEAHSQRLALLNRNATDLNAARDVAAVLRAALQALHEALETASAAGVLFETDVPQSAPAILAQDRLPALAGAPALDLQDNPLLTRLADSRAHLLFDADRPATESPVRPDHLAWVGPAIVAALYLPLVAENRLVGVLGLGHEAGGRFSSGDVDLAWAMAQQAVLAVQNLRLREKTQEQAVITQVARALSRAADRTELFDLLREELGAAAGVQTFTLALYDQTRNLATFPLVVEAGAAAAAAASTEARTPTGLVRYIIQNRQAVRLTGDVTAQAQALGIPLVLPAHHPVRGRGGPAGAPLAKAYLGVPLLLGERVTGVLVAEDPARPDAFGDQHERLLAMAASQTAIALDNIQLYEQARQGLAAVQARADRLEALAEVTVGLASLQRTDQVAAAALDQARRLVPYDRAHLWLRTPNGRPAPAWRLVGARGEAAAPAGAAQSFEPGTPLGDAVMARRVTVVPDTGQDARFGGAGRSWLAAPLVSGDETVGVLEFVAAGTGTLSAAQEAGAQALAARVAAALESARRFEAGVAQAESLDQHAQELALLNRAALALARPQDVETLLATTTRLAAEALNAPQAATVVFATETSDLRADRLPPSGPHDPAAAEAALAAQTVLERVAAARERVTLAELNAIRPVPAEQTLWIGGAPAALFAPLTADGQVLGVLAAGASPADHAFTEAERDLAARLADLAAAALQVAIQHEQATLRLAEQTTINQISRALSRTLEMRELLDSIHEQMAAWLGPKTLNLAVYDDTSNEVSFPLARTLGQPHTTPPRAPQGLLRHVLHDRQTLLASADAPEKLEALSLTVEALGEAKSFLGVPLAANGQLLGALTLTDPQAVPALTESHARILTALAGQMAVTLDNARRYEQARQALAATQARAAETIASTRAEAEDAIAAARAQAAQAVTTAEARATQAIAVAQERAYNAEGLAEAYGVVTAAQRVDEVLDRALAQLGRLLPYTGATYWRRGPGLEQAWVPAATRRPGADDDTPAPTPLPPDLAREVVASRAPVFVPDMSRDERFPGNGSRRAAAWLGVPVIGQAEFVGVLAVEAGEPNAYAPSQVNLAQNFAQQAGVALENASQHEASLRRAHEFEQRGTVLAGIAAELNSTLDLEVLLPLALRLLSRALAADRAGLVVFDQPAAAPRALRVRAQAQVPSSAAEALAPHLAGNTLVERLRETQRPVVIEDLENEKLIRREHLAWAGEGFWSGLLLPLVHHGQVLGVLGLGAAEARVWTPLDLDLAQALAAQTAVAVHNAHQHAEVHDRLQEQTLVAQIVRALSRATDVQSLAEVLRARVSAWLNADSLYLALYDEARNEVTLPLLIDSGQTRAAAPFAPGGLLRHVLQTRRPLRLGGDLGQQCRDLGIAVSFVTHRPQRWAADTAEALTAQSYLAAPVLLGEKVFGVLAVEVNDRAEAFTERHERILGTIAAQAAVILDNTRLHEETRQALAAAQERVAQLEVLTTALSTLAAVLYSDDAVGVALEQFQRVIPYDRAAFWQRETAGGPARDLRWRLMGARGQAEPHDRAAAPDVIQQTLFGELVLGRRVIYVPDTARDGRFTANPHHVTRSWMGVPLVSKGDVIAVVVLEKVEANAYDANQAAPAQVLANQVTAVLGNARQFEANVQRVVELDERARRLAFLNRFGAQLGASLDLSHILQLSVKALAEALGVEHGAAAAFDEQRTTLLALEHFPASTSASGPMGQLLLPGNTLLERLQETPAPIAVEDLNAPEGAARLRAAEWVGAEVRAAMFVPLMHSGRLVGLVGLGQAQPGRRFTPDEMELSMALANQAAAAVHMARQHDRTQQRLAEQATINQITRAFSQAPDVRTLCEVLRQQLDAWIGPARLYLAAYAEERNEVTFPLAVEQGEAIALAPRAPSGLVRHLIQQRQPVRLNGEITQQLKNLGLYVTGLGSAVGLEDVADFTAYLGVPVAAGERAAGVLILAGPRRAEAFDESHERILSAVAGQLAAALETARQHEQALALTAAAQTRAAQLSELTDATGVIASAQRSDQVVTLTLDQLQRLIPYDSVQYWRREAGRNGTGGHPAGAESWRLAAARGAQPADAPSVLEPAMLQRSPLAEVLSLKGPLVVGDTAQDGRFERAGAWLGIPLIHNGEVLGLLALDKREPGAFTPALVPLAEAFGKQAAVALANVRVFEESLQRTVALDERASLLNRVAAAFSTSVEPQVVLQNALAILTDLLHVERGAALLLDDSRTATRARAQAHYPPTQAYTGSLTLTGNAVLGQLRESLAPLAAEAVEADPVVTPDHTTWIAPDLTAALFLPLVVAGKLTGLLGFGVTTGRRRFAPAELELAMTLANQTAIAVHNARLYQRTQRRMVELATISQSSHAISQTIDLAQLFETVRAQVETNLRADSLYLALYDEARGEVTFPLAIEHGQPVEIETRPPDRLIGHILSTRQSLLLTGDISRKLAEAGVAPGAEVRAKAYLGVPLVLGTKVRGVLAVEDYQRAYAFTDKHERSLAAIAAPVAAAVDGARIYQESAQRALALDARAALLGRLAGELNETLELVDVLRVTAQVVTETLLADVGGAIALDEAPDALLAAAIARFPDDDPDLQSPVMAGSPLVRQLTESLSPLSLDDVTTNADQRAELTSWLGADVQSALFLPLVTADQLMGLVAVGHKSAERSFTPGEVDLALTIASQASVALANARAQQKLQPRLAELATISRINQILGQPANLAQLCDSLRVELGGALQAEVLYLALPNESQTELSFPLFAEGGQARVASPRPPAGAVALILNERQALRLNGDVAEQLAARGAPYQPLAPELVEPRSLLGVPLVLGQRLLGALVVEDHAQVGRFGPSQEFILTTLATPIAVAVENAALHAERARLARDVEAQAAQLALIQRLSTRLQGAAEPTEIVRRVLDELQPTLRAGHIAAAINLNPASSAWRVVRPSAIADEALSVTPAGLRAWLQAANGPLAIYAVAEESRFPASDLSWVAPSLESAVALPLRAGSDLIGAIVLGESAAPRVYGERELDTAITAANQAAAAITLAGLYNAAHHAHLAAAAQAEQLRLTDQVTQRIAAALDTEAVITTALDELPRVLPYEHATLWLITSDQSVTRLRVAGARGSAQLGLTVDPAEQPLLAETLASGVVSVPDTQTDSRFAGDTGHAHRSWLGVALRRDDESVGLLVLEKSEPDYYQAQHAALAQAVGRHLAAALENARQHEASLAQAAALDTEARRLALLQRATEAVHGTLDLRGVLNNMLGEAAAALGADLSAAVVFADPAAGRPQLLAQAPPQTAAAPALEPGHPFWDRLQARQPVVVEDTAAERLRPEHLAWLGNEVKSALVLPLHTADQWIGALAVGQVRQRRHFTPAEVALGQALAGRLAGAVANASHYQQVTHQRDDHHRLIQLRQALATARDTVEISAAVNEPLREALRADTYYLALFNAAADEVAFGLLVEGGQPREVRPLPPEGVIDHILQTRQTLRLAGDVGRALKDMGLAHRGTRARRETGDPSASRAYVGVPIVAGERVLGVLAVEDTQRAEAFSEAQVAWLEAAAREVSAALGRLNAQAEAARSAAELDDYRAQYAQASQAAQSFEHQLQTRAREFASLQERYAEAVRTAEALDRQSRVRGKSALEARARHAQAAAAARELAQTLAQRGETLRQWRARAEALLAAQPPAFAPNLPAVLERQLLVASRALSAEYAALYLNGEKPASFRLGAAVGDAGPTAGKDVPGLAQAALDTQAPVYIPHLETDPRWSAIGAASAPADGQTPDAAGQPEDANGQFRSALALPVPVERGQAPGALVFLTTRTDGFNSDQAPVARAAASQVAFALEGAALAGALQSQTARFRELLAEPAAAWAPVPTLEDQSLEPLPAPPDEGEIAVPALVSEAAREPQAAPAAAETTRPPVAEPTRPVTPTWQPPLPTGALPEAAPADIPEIRRPAARPLWQRAAIPAAVVLVAVCGLAAIARGPLSSMAAGLFGGATDTAPAATQTTPAILAPSATSETTATAAPSEAPTTEAPPSPTSPPPTATRTAAPTQTETPAETSTPTITPTPPLPPDVVAVALVDLPEGIGGRLRDAPNGNVVGGVPGNTQVHVLAGRETTSDGITWVRIRIPDTGQTGWFAEDLLIYEDEAGG